MQERIEQQEKKIYSLELSKKVGSIGVGGQVKSGQEQLVKRLEDSQEREKELIKQKHKLQEENTKMKYDIER